MTGILVAFTITLLIPLFVATWRTSLLGLATQGALMAALAVRHQSQLTMELAMTLVDLVAIRTIAAPSIVYFVLLAQKAPPRNNVIAPNLLSWGTALALVVLSFRCADVLVPETGDEQLLIAVAASAFLLGMFVLATSRGTTSQVVGLLRLENAIALYELGETHHLPLSIRICQTILLLGTILFCRWYLMYLTREEPAGAPVVGRAPVL